MGKIARKSLAIAIIAIFFGLASMPAIGEINHLNLESEKIGWNKNHEKVVEIEVTQYKSDGSIEVEKVKLTQSNVSKLKSELINAKTIEERLPLLKKYGIIPQEVTPEDLKKGMYAKAESMGLSKERIQKIVPQYGTKTLIPPILIAFLSRVDAVYFFGNSLRIGLSPIIDLLYFIAGWGMKKIDFFDTCWGMFGVVSTEGLLVSHSFVGMPSITWLAGFVGYSIKFPLTMHIFTGYSVMIFAIGIGIHDVSFLPQFQK